jgi:hypothetical protein
VEPAGAGALFVENDHAWLGIGVTKPELRRNGGQRALLGPRRVSRRALNPPSYHNIRSLGFSVAYVRPNWELPA